MTEGQFVVVTRYVAPSGRRIVHTYGTWATRRRAETVRDAILRDVADVIVEATVCKILTNDEATG